MNAKPSGTSGHDHAGFCDWNAGAPVEPDVLELFCKVERNCPGNPASAHGPGRRARATLENARQQIAAALAVAVDDVLFTSGGTEAANLAVHGLGDAKLPVLLAAVEHPAALAPAQRRGVVDWSVDVHGAAMVGDPRQPIGLICLVHAQSELGTLQPVVAAAELAKSLGVPLFVDAAQTLGKVSLTEAVEVAQAVALSPHKCGGMRGHGVLIVRDLEQRLRPLLRGGGQEHSLRPGTQSPALAAANALAIARAVAEWRMRGERMLEARSAFLRGLVASGVGHRVLTPLHASIANTVMVTFAHCDGRSLLPMLDLAGIHASHGSACSSGSPTPPPILRCIGLDDAAARASVRFSFGWRIDAKSMSEIGQRVGDVVRSQQKNV